MKVLQQKRVEQTGMASEIDELVTAPHEYLTDYYVSAVHTLCY